MCGISGFLDLEAQPATNRAALTARARTMAERLVHRGPDDVGTWVDPEVGLGLGFRRLAIVDLSPAGHQPMESASGRFVIAFNGEIYNHRDLRRRLADEDQCSIEFRGHCDTEVLLAAIECWGLAKSLQQAVGMFAIAVWDRREQTLTLARDRIGEKPLYYGLHHRTLLFASELKALVAHPAFDDSLDREALNLFLDYGYIPAPHSAYQGISKLTPGSLVQFSARTLRGSTGVLPEPIAFWSAKEVAEGGQATRFSGSFEDAAGQLEGLLRETISSQMVADVPVGAFLSGGIDSSLVVALMQTQSARKVKTFTIGFHETAYNEATYAKQVAQHLGTDHTELYVLPAEAQAVIPSLPTIYDEPFADSSQIATHLVSRLAQQHVTVSLSGDGGDELFGGYSRYPLAVAMWKAMRLVPVAVRKPLAHLISATPPNVLDTIFAWLGPLANRHGAPDRISGKLYRLAEIFQQRSVEGLYRSIVAQTALAARDLPASRSIFTRPEQWARLENLFEKVMYLDLMTYLPDDILVKVDRAAMSVSLETRVPLLDHRLIEFAWRLPLPYKYRDGRGKAILRRILARHVPPALTERPKMGFSVPIGQWLRGPLRAWASDLLEPRQLSASGLFDTAEVQRIWQQHLGGRRDRQRELWKVLMFQAWNQTRDQSRYARRDEPAQPVAARAMHLVAGRPA
ncbi:MAG TPA: asparagine synthase (glutamine-hydrolyzing) [Pirellulales bacterium]|jgi:asparagine synthase (glutamine-hydrolysing)|nr:asparagine synthase (glutamine-hydrolyzing) [Pirellulales bacterium]